MDETQERWRSEFKVITRSQESADRLIALITAYTNRSRWTWEETAELTKRDLLSGKSIEEVIKWFANIVQPGRLSGLLRSVCSCTPCRNLTY